MLSLLLFCVLLAAWTYLVLVPLAWGIREALLKLGNHVLNKRDH